MADTKAGQEPSMEEILSSIRRIIAEDDAGPEPAAGGPRPAEGHEAAAAPPPPPDEDDDDDDDVLELTEVVGDPEPPLPDAMRGTPRSVAAAPPAVLPVPASSSPPPPRPTNPAQEASPMPAHAAEALISPVAASASTQALARLAKAAATDEKKGAPVAGVTVEELLVDLLTPMLRDWLDKNLPEIVERVVEQEVKKLARRAELM
jgi:uncharacterized protein